MIHKILGAEVAKGDGSFVVRKEEKAGKAKMAVRNEFSNAHLQIIAFFHAKRSDKKEN